VTKGISRGVEGMPCFSTKLVAINECDAPESKSTVAGALPWYWVLLYLLLEGSALEAGAEVFLGPFTELE
jgi:hypothetical protein